MLKNLIITSLLLFGSVLGATYVYEDNQDLYDLRNYSGTTNLNVGDDQVSAKFNFGFDFTYYDNTFTFARMATNGCLHLGLNSTGYNDYCGDYTPDPLPQYSNTLFPFWTDLIRDNGSKMLAKNILNSNDEDLYTIFGWYNLREYNRSNTDNSFEVWLYPNNTFEYRYGALNINKHDVLIGEQGPTTTDIYQYHFHDECNTGTTNTSSCVNQDWNQSTMNTTLENGGSLYGIGSGNSLDCSSPLNNEACVGYAAAYLIQQCGLSALYDTSCTGYATAYLIQQCDLNSLYNSSCTGYEAAYLSQQCGLDDLYDTACPNYDIAYDDQQCENDPQYSPSCPGYTQTESVAYYEETEEVDYGYITEYDDDPYAGMELTDQEWYEIDVQEFGQEQADEWYGTDVAFTEEGYINYNEYDTTEEEYWTNIDEGMEEYDAEQEEIWAAEELAWQEEQERIYEEDIIHNEQLVLEEENIIIEDTQWEMEEESYFVDSYEEDTLALMTYEDEIFDIHQENYDTDVTLVYDVIGEEEEFIELFEFNTIITEDIEYEEEENYLAFENVEELDEWYEEEMEEAHETIEEQFVEAEEESYEEEAVEEVYADLEEEWIEEDTTEEEVVLLEEVADLERDIIEDEEESKSSMTQEMALSVVASTVQAATESVSGTTSGTSTHSTGNTAYSGGVSNVSSSVSSSSISTTTAVVSSVSGGTISTISSPSISAQVTAAAVQTQTILDTIPTTTMDMGSSIMEPTVAVVETVVVEVATTEEVATTQTLETATDTTTSVETTIDSGTVVASTSTEDTTDTDSLSSTTTSTATVASTTEVENIELGSQQVAVVEVQVQDMQGQIDTAVADAGTASEADQIADQIIAQNIQSQQQEAETYQQETGQYGDESALVAYLGYNPGFTDYYGRSIPRKDDWYEPRVIYADAYIGDNINAFYQLAGNNLNTLQQMRDLQPTL